MNYFELKTAFACIALLCLSLFACSNEADLGNRGAAGEAGAPVTGTYAAKCNLACTPVKSCSKEDPSRCASDCVTTTEGLTAACAQCVVEHTHWEGSYCVNGSLCVIGADCYGGCTTADDKCTGYGIAKTTDSACATVCE